MAIHLGRSLPSASCDPPERRRGDPPGSPDFRATCRSYSVLLPVGFSLPPPLPAARCALTAPFHPCRLPGMPETGRRCTFCGTFPGVAPAGRYPAPHLRGARTFLSPHTGGERPSDRLATTDLGSRTTSVKAPAEAFIIGAKCFCIATRERNRHAGHTWDGRLPLRGQRGLGETPAGHGVQRRCRRRRRRRPRQCLRFQPRQAPDVRV